MSVFEEDQTPELGRSLLAEVALGHQNVLYGSADLLEVDRLQVQDDDARLEESPEVENSLQFWSGDMRLTPSTIISTVSEIFFLFEDNLLPASSTVSSNLTHLATSFHSRAPSEYSRSSSSSVKTGAGQEREEVSLSSSSSLL